MISIYSAFFEFTDIGIEPIIWQEIPFLNKNELDNIGNYYSIIFGTTQVDQGLLFGPLPVAYHYDQLVFVYGNMIKDTKIKDPRTIAKGNLTPCFLLIFFPVQHDQPFSRCRTAIRKEIDTWFQNMRDINDMTVNSLNMLNEHLLRIVGVEQEKISEMSVTNTSKVALSKNFDFLNAIGDSLKRPIRIGTFGTTNDVLATLRSAISLNFTHLMAMHSSANRSAIVFRFPKLCIEAANLQEDELLDFRKTAALTYPGFWKDAPKHFDGFLLTIKYPSNDEIVKRNIQIALNGTLDKCPISLLVKYTSQFSGKISDTPIPRAIANATKRTISLVESREGEGVIETAFIDLASNIVNRLQSSD